MDLLLIDFSGGLNDARPTDPLASSLHRMPSTRVQLAEAIDRVMHKGAVLRGDVVISVADVDFLYLDLRVVLSAVDTAMRPAHSGRDESSTSDPEGSNPNPPPPFSGSE